MKHVVFRRDFLSIYHPDWYQYFSEDKHTDYHVRDLEVFSSSGQLIGKIIGTFHSKEEAREETSLLNTCFKFHDE